MLFVRPPFLRVSAPQIFVCASSLFNWSAMGNSPVKGFNSPAAKQIITKEHSPDQNKVDKEACDTATFAAGCFWGVQLAFQRVPGVVDTMVGYTDGRKENPSYEEVCRGNSGHTEAVQMMFNPELVSFKDLMVVLFDRMDPTTLDRQGNDRGTQYRSGIYYHSEQQKEEALEFIKEVQPKYNSKIVVEVKKASKFWPAEDYHQKYLEKGSQKAEKGCLEPIKCYG